MKVDVEKKVAAYFDKFGVNAINLIIDRHELADRKRGLFTLRYVSEDKEKEKELTEQMNQLSSQIAEIDNRLEKMGITAKMRPSIVKDIKKAYPNGGWTSRFGEDF